MMSSGLEWEREHRQGEVLRNSDGSTVGRVERDGFVDGIVWVAYSEPDGGEVGRYPTRGAAKEASERRLIGEYQASLKAGVF